MTEQEPLYTVAEVAQYLQVTTRTVYRLIEDDRLKAKKITPKLLRVPAKSLQEFIDCDQ